MRHLSMLDPIVHYGRWHVDTRIAVLRFKRITLSFFNARTEPRACCFYEFLLRGLTRSQCCSWIVISEGAILTLTHMKSI
jgi:hypothetical protein